MLLADVMRVLSRTKVSVDHGTFCTFQCELWRNSAVFTKASSKLSFTQLRRSCSVEGMVQPCNASLRICRKCLFWAGGIH